MGVCVCVYGGGEMLVLLIGYCEGARALAQSSSLKMRTKCSITKERSGVERLGG